MGLDDSRDGPGRNASQSTHIAIVELGPDYSPRLDAVVELIPVEDI